MANLTPWFPARTTPPVRRGVYERDLTDTGLSERKRFAYWDGSKWYGYAQNPKSAKDSHDGGHVSSFQDEGLWRGLIRAASTRTTNNTSTKEK